MSKKRYLNNASGEVGEQGGEQGIRPMSFII